MLPRTKARKRALDILHSADVTGRAPVEVLAGEEEPVPKFARTLVHGVAAHSTEIDAIIGAAADRWTIERMPVVDRNLLRIAIFELLFAGDTPAGVAINEAVELAKLLSTEDSGRFVNGLLGRVARERGVG
jgi:transcription antitermination protein NusB